ncbi:MAG TPA: LysE family transporter [Kofleriaceae bacterium]|nr:LysE family transporter [Kofleriaceae bacterium]
MNGASPLVAAGLGFGLGVVTGMPLGVLNVAIIDAATAGRRRFARGIGIGGGVADTLHAIIAFAGVGHVVTADPALVRGLAITTATAIIAYAVRAWRRRQRTLDPRVDARTDDEVSVARGLATGIILTLPNPAALAAWVAVAAAVWPGATLLEASLIAGGVGIGSALWFTLLARWIRRMRRDHPVLTWIPRVALVFLIAIAVVGIVRVL